MLRSSLIFFASLLIMGCQTTPTKFGELTLKPAIDHATAAYQQGDLHLAEGLWRRLLERDPSLLVGGAI